VKAVLDIPDDLAAELERQAKLSGRATSDQMLHLMRLAVLVEHLPLSDFGRFAGAIRTLVEARNRLVHGVGPINTQTDPVTGLSVVISPSDALEKRPPKFEIDPATGLRAIVSPADAPIHSMSAQDALELEQSILEEQDLERAGLSLRH